MALMAMNGRLANLQPRIGRTAPQSSEEIVVILKMSSPVVSLDCMVKKQLHRLYEPKAGNFLFSVDPNLARGNVLTVGHFEGIDGYDLASVRNFYDYGG